MYKETIEYTDYNGVSRKETFYFNLNQAELTKMELGTTGGLVERLQTIIDAKDGEVIMKTFDKIMALAYGEKSDDGRRLVKSKELYEAFSQTEAYNILYMKICTDANFAAEFIKQVLPAESELNGNKPAVVPAN